MVYNSIIISFVITLFKKLYDCYLNSFVSKLSGRLASFFKSAFSHSNIWKFLKASDIFSHSWKQSRMFKMVDWLLNSPIMLLQKIFYKFEKAFEGSLIFKIILFLANRFELLVGISLFIILIIPHQYWNNLYSTLFAALLLILFVIKAAYKKESFHLLSIDFALFTFIILVFISQFTSILPKDSFRFLLFYLTCFTFVLIMVSSVKNSKSLNGLAEILVLGISASAIYGVGQAIAGVPFDPSLTDINLNEGMAGRIYSTMGNPNNYAEILVLTIPFYFSVILNSTSYLKKSAYTLLLLPVFIALYYTGSRSSWLAFAGTILVYVFLKNRKLIPLVVILGILSYPLLPNSIHRRIMTLFMGTDSSTGYRLLILKSFFPMLKDYWFTGVGLGMEPFVQLFQKYYEYTKIQDTINTLELYNTSFLVDMYYSIPTTPPHTHNLYLQIWIETGLAGLLTFLWFIARLIKKSFICIFNSANKSVNNLLIAGISGLAGSLAIALAEHIWFYPRVMLIFWAVIGIVLNGLSIGRQDMPDNKET